MVVVVVVVVAGVVVVNALVTDRWSQVNTTYWLVGTNTRSNLRAKAMVGAREPRCYVVRIR